MRCPAADAKRTLAAAAILLSSMQPVLAQSSRVEDPLRRVTSASCEHGTIACFETKTGVIDTSDCALGGGVYVDFYRFAGTVGQTVTVNMTSSVMDSYVYLADPLPSVSTRASDNDGGGGYDARLEYTIADSPGEWYIGASHLKTLGLGAYSLTLECGPSGPDSCAPDAETLCIDDLLADRRFEVGVALSGPTGAARAVSLAQKGVGRGGLFWFFSAENPELMIKVLDGCALNDHFWVFYSATTDVGFTLTVTDTETGHTFSRTNPDHHPADTVQATDALPCS